MTGKIAMLIVAIVMVFALAACADDGSGKTFNQIAAEARSGQNTATPPSSNPEVAAAVQATVDAMNLVQTQPTATPNLIVQPTTDANLVLVAQPTGVTIQSAGLEGFQTYSYLPGGEGFGQFATDVVLPQGYNFVDGDCGRLWQATNLENLPWTAIFCRWAVSEPAPRIQWPHATQLTTTGTGSVSFLLFRDHGAVSQLQERGQYNGQDPYEVANAKDSPLGLGWFAQGFNGSICVDVNGQRTQESCISLNGGGVYQLNFPRDMQGYYLVTITANNGQVQFWQGERRTSTDNWPTPPRPTQ